LLDETSPAAGFHTASMDIKHLPDTLIINPSILYFGTPVVLITTRNEDGSSNITPMSSAWSLADRVVIGLAGGGRGLANLQREGECVLNLASESMHAAIERMAPTSGNAALPTWKQEAGYRYEADKFALAGLHAAPSIQVQAPRITECPLQLEARVTHHVFRPLDAWRTDAGGFAIIELEVLHVHAHADVVVPGTQHIDPSCYSPLFYLFRHYVGRGEHLGKTFKAQV
jgi:flavin reductase (DIM6/NTAB) family NADH-FMN oxidoreductase RutF